MANVFKPKYPIMRAAVDANGDQVTFTDKKGRVRCRREPVRDAAGDIVYRKAKHWYIKYENERGDTVTVKGFTDKDATEQRKNELVRMVARRETGLEDRFRDHRRRPILEHLAEWLEAIRIDKTRDHADKRYGRVKRVIEGCGFDTWDNIRASTVVVFISKLKQGKTDPRPVNKVTRKAYRDAVKAFLGWMVQDQRAPSNPLAHLTGGPVETETSRERRAWADDELRQLLKVTKAQPKRYGLAGETRAMMYRLTVETGLRQNEVRTLTPEVFNLDADPPTVTVLAAYAKNRRQDTLPLLPGTAGALKPIVGATKAGKRVFPLPENRKQVMRTLRADQDAAREAWIAEATDPKEREAREKSDFLCYVDHEGRYADFHSLRHTFITNLARGGVAVKVAMDAARHSDVNLTMKRYAHTLVGDRAKAMEVLPDLGDPKPETESPAVEARKLGTNDMPTDDARIHWRIYSDSAETGCHLSGDGGEMELDAICEGDENSDEQRRLSAYGGDMVPSGGTADEGTRTLNPGFTKAVHNPHGAIKNADSDARIHWRIYPQSGGGVEPPPELPPDLARVVGVWGELPEHARVTVLAIVDAVRLGARGGSG